ncbi:alpha/beta hydrolase-fold protein [Streptomyces sp. Z423-1]|uniref:carboxylesterase family protein n=1 Tax=Streptomyces sp. Z423-1 TaxID=2730915 RepID=UPI001F0CE8F9|nr:alpha/beta hydrolase-fold protein [Streptomyces sp. Z423-1]
MHDAAVLSSDPLTTLVQGNGATCWASPQDQARRPAFVLAPQYSSAVVDDHGGYTVTSWLETTVNLLNNVTETYSIDTDRLYTTGQSMGAIMSIVMDIEYPDLFAASYIVAGQWDTSLVAPMANDKLWITVSQGDESAYPGQNAITAALEEKGATVTRAVWDGTSTQKEFAAGVRKMVAKRTSINYVAFEKGTVVPSGVTDNSLNNHLYTWKIAYNIEGIREWIFKRTSDRDRQPIRHLKGRRLGHRQRAARPGRVRAALRHDGGSPASRTELTTSQDPEPVSPDPLTRPCPTSYLLVEVTHNVRNVEPQAGLE